MFGDYYQSELAYLRELGSAFAEVNPEIAGLLQQRGTDPDVERLLEGFAFLTARIREQADACVPEAVHTLLELLYPHYLRPFPAAAIIQLAPRAFALDGRTPIPRHSEIRTRPAKGHECKFRTCIHLDVVPARVVRSQKQPLSVSQPALRVWIQCDSTRTVFTREKLRFYIAADIPAAASVLLCLARYLSRVEFAPEGSSDATATLEPKAVSLPSFSPEFHLVPPSPTTPRGLTVARDYFAFPEGFLFFDVGGFERLSPASNFELRFVFEQNAPLPVDLMADAVLLNCVPVVNLWKESAVPLQTGPIEKRTLIRSLTAHPQAAEVYNVVDVTAHQKTPARRLKVSSFTEFEHAAPQIDVKQECHNGYYRLWRKISPVDGYVDTFLSLATARDQKPPADGLLLTLDAEFTNRSLPTLLKKGDVCLATDAVPEAIAVQQVSRVSPPVIPPLHDDHNWTILATLALGVASLSRVEVLREMLRAESLTFLSPSRDKEAARLRIEALRSVVTTADNRLLENAFVGGSKSLVEADDRLFVGPGDVFLFGCVLNEIYASYVGINTYHQLSVKLQQAGMVLEWEPRTGETVLI